VEKTLNNLDHLKSKPVLALEIMTMLDKKKSRYSNGVFNKLETYLIHQFIKLHRGYKLMEENNGRNKIKKSTSS